MHSTGQINQSPIGNNRVSKFLELSSCRSGTKVLVNVKNIDSISVFTDKVSSKNDLKSYTKIKMASGGEHIVIEDIETIMDMLETKQESHVNHMEFLAD